MLRDVRRPDVLRDLRRAQEDMNRLFGGVRFAPRSEFPAVNVWAGADGAIVTAEVPGVSPDQIDVTVHQDTVTLRGKREPEAAAGDAVEHRRERTYGPFVRTVVLPFRVDADQVCRPLRARRAHARVAPARGGQAPANHDRPRLTVEDKP